MRKALLLVAVAALAMIGAVSAQSGNAFVRVAHLSPDAPAVDIWVDGSRAITNLAFKQITNYVALPAGGRNIVVVPAGQTSPEVIKATANLQAGRYYTIAARGRLASIAPSILEDNIGTVTGGQAGVRIVHMSPDAPAVDVAVTGGPILFNNLPFPQVTTYLFVASGTYHLEVRIAGTSTVALPLPGVTFEAGRRYSVFAVGLAGDGTLTVVPVVDSAMGGGNR
jgi:hypothetical protein